MIEHLPGKQYVYRAFESHLSSSFFLFCGKRVSQVSCIAMLIYVHVDLSLVFIYCIHIYTCTYIHIYVPMNIIVNHTVCYVHVYICI